MGVRVREKVKGSKIFWVFINHNGTRRSVKVGSKAAAKEVARKIEAKLTLGKAAFPERKAAPTLKEYYEQFSRVYMKTLKRTTRYTYDGSFQNHVLPKLGKLRLDEIDRAKMEVFITDLVDQDLAKDSIRNILAPLGVLFTDAVEKGIVQYNPTQKVGKFYRQAKIMHEDIEPLSVEESLLFFEAAKQYNPTYYPLFLVALHAGLRSGEIAGLQWDDIDWNGKFLRVRRAVVRYQLTTVKTKQGRRKVDLSDELIKTLADLRKKMQKTWLRKGSNTIPVWVFANKFGSWVEMSNVKKRDFKLVLHKAGLRHIRFHDLRHTYASLLLANGAPITYVSNQMGHANSQITLKVYCHWMPDGNQRNAVNQLPVLGQELDSIAQAK